MRQMEKEKAKIEKALHLLAAQRFACQHDAQQAIAGFRKQNKWKW
ncbi:hypothetical protein, partial [Paenibacillus alkaliterrae]